MVEAMKALLLKERQEKRQLEMELRDEICNEMVEQMRQREQWCRYQPRSPQPCVIWDGVRGKGLGLNCASVFSPSLPLTVFAHFSDSEHLDTQKELLEEMYEEKLKILKESLTGFYKEEIQVSYLEPAPNNGSDHQVTWGKWSFCTLAKGRSM